MLEVNLFIPCFVDQVSPKTGLAMARLLEHLGCRVQYNPAQTCCGQPAFNAGFFEEAADVARKFLYDFDTVTSHYIVGPSASCVGMVRNSYPMLFAKSGDGMPPPGLQPVRNRIQELSQFIVHTLKIERIPGARYEGRVAFHDSCAGLRECGIYREPRQLLSSLAGLELVELPDNETCCGFGGTFAIKFEAISVGMAQQKVDNALAVGADTIVSTDPSCLMHLQAYIDKQGLPIKTMHLADVLVSGLDAVAKLDI